jgi:AbrB family looped-hinge helix DNA binding protein
MAVFETRLTSKGQMTLPVEIRRLWDLKAGDRVEFYADRSGQFFLRPLNARPSAFFENLPARKKSARIKNDEDAIAKAVLQRDRRSKTRTAAE